MDDYDWNTSDALVYSVKGLYVLSVLTNDFEILGSEGFWTTSNTYGTKLFVSECQSSHDVLHDFQDVPG